MWVCRYFVWFVMYSVFGWIYESTYCTIKERKWENRGFLYGPACPIYGTGIVAMMMLWHHVTEQGGSFTWWQVFLISFFGSAVLEYVTHWTLEKLFHAYWWDYRDMPLNLNGRICLPASTLFGLGGLLVVYVLYEPTLALTEGLSIGMVEAAALVLMAIMAADTAITVSALTAVARTASAINRSVNAHMDRFVAEAVERGESAAGQLQGQRDEALAVVSRERERFSAALRDARLGDMNHMARAALRRARGFADTRRLPNMPDAAQLASLWNDVRARHWPH